MIRTKLGSEHIKRTIRPLYGWSQATPVHVYLDPAWDRSTNVFPGYAMKLTNNGGDLVAPVGFVGGTITGVNSGLGDACYGISANFIGGDGIDELLDQGVNAMAVWVLGPDAQFDILGDTLSAASGGLGAFDVSQAWSSAVPGALIYAYTDGTRKGQLALAGGTSGGATAVATTTHVPVAKLIKVVSASQITIAGLRPSVSVTGAATTVA